MGKKSSKANKGKAAASKAAGTSRGNSTSSQASASSPLLHGASSSSASTSLSPLPAATASPASALPSASVGASSSSPSPSAPAPVPVPASASPALQVPPAGSRAAGGDGRMSWVEKQILDLLDCDRRENALAELSMKRVAFQGLAPLLWFSFGTVAILLQEVLSVYPLLSPPSLTPEQSNRVCNALALLQCVAAHPDTKILFAQARIPFYLYVFLGTIGESRPFEYLRLATLGVIGALVKVPETRVTIFLLSSEIMPLCLRAMETGSALSRTVATFIVQRLLLDDVGLQYVCYLPERVFAVNHALGNVIASLAEQTSTRLLKHVIRCYLRLLDDARSIWVLRNFLPKRLTDGTFDHCLREDQTARMWLQQLLGNLLGRPVTEEDCLGDSAR
ncbi:CCR4-NOT transcription complex subunit [Sesamum alatum]|uniref:CCR4-NOT transcription complex subunit n=1 Tax=Sesamum alatum TaxID=300844 RepID=A0AAE2CYX8_9LAMI|nr:CCR4-NOT transcription complex subunit [Sesamum alatum]